MFGISSIKNLEQNQYQKQRNTFVNKSFAGFKGDKLSLNQPRVDSFNFNPSDPKRSDEINKPLSSLSDNLNGILKNLKDSTFGLLSEPSNLKPAYTKDYYELKDNLIKSLSTVDKEELVVNIALLGKLNAKDAIQPLIEMLEKNSTEPKVAIEIVNALAEIQDPKTVQPIIDVLTNKSRDNHLRTVCAITLGNMKNRKASKPLFEILRNQSDDALVRSYAALALTSFPTIRNKEQLVRSLDDASELVRANSALALGAINHQEAIPDLIRLLKDNDTQVKANSALALGNLKAGESLNDLINALEDTNSSVIISIARAIANIDRKKAAEKLIRVVDNTTNPIILRRNAAACLQMLKDPKAVNVLNAILEDKNEDLILRNYSLAALINMNSASTAPALRSILTDQTENFKLRINAAAGLGMLADQNSIQDLLSTALKAEVAELKNNCINAVRNIVAISKGNVQVSSTQLLPFLKDDNERIRALTADTLGMLGKKEAVDDLLSLAVNTKEEGIVRAYAISALGNIRDESAKQPLMNILKNDKDHLICSRAAASLYAMGAKKDLFNIVNSQTESYQVKNHAAGVLIGMGEKDAVLENFLKPGLNVTKLHKLDIKGQGIEVAVIDEELDPNHPEFDDRVIIEPLKHHGTLVAGNLGGNISGVAPKAIIHGYNAFSLKNDNGINIALEKIIKQKISGENDIKVVNASLGFNSKLISNTQVQQIIETFDKFAYMANKLGITVVVSAGNDGRDLPIPGLGTINLLCLSDHIISVGATMNNGTPDDPDDDGRAEFSSYPGKDLPRQLDVMAPGFEVTLPYAGGSYKTVDGTSFSSPFVAGLVSLMYQVNPEIKPQQVKNILKSTATRLKNVPDNMQGSGQVNPLMAVVKALALTDEARAADLACKLGIEDKYDIQGKNVPLTLFDAKEAKSGGMLCLTA